MAMIEEVGKAPFPTPARAEDCLCGCLLKIRNRRRKMLAWAMTSLPKEMGFPFEIGVALASLKTIKMVGGERKW